MAGFSSFRDYTTNGGGNATGYLMSALNSSAKTPVYSYSYGNRRWIRRLLQRGFNVVKTSRMVNRDGMQGSEMFGSSRRWRAYAGAFHHFGSVGRLLEVIPGKTKEMVSTAASIRMKCHRGPADTTYRYDSCFHGESGFFRVLLVPWVLLDNCLGPLLMSLSWWLWVSSSCRWDSGTWKCCVSA